MPGWQIGLIIMEPMIIATIVITLMVQPWRK